MKKKSNPRIWGRVVQGLPLAAAIGASFSTSSRLGQQLIILIVLLWIQVFFIVEVFVIK